MTRTCLALLFSLPVFTACQLYNTQFECPPGEGVPCASVSEIESMIIETPSGPDLFIGRVTQRGCECRNKPAACSNSMHQKWRVVWVAESIDASGNICGEHYIKIQDPQEGCY